jgi:serine/threonine protein kinase
VDQDDDSDAYSDIQSDSDVSESDPNGPAYVVIQMEYCIRTVGKSSIGQHEVNIEQSWTLFEKITQALGLIHEKGLIHRDVKPSNILVGEDEEVKIGDFGHACWASCYKNGGKGTPDCGTTFYMAPELDQGPVTDKVDIYSLGVTLLEIFCSFGSLHERASVMQDLKNGKYPTNFSGDIDLLKKLTASCPPQRPSTVDILEYIAQRQ